MSEIGASGEPQKAYEVGDKIGTYLADLGFNMDFAPVADVLTNPENTVVARRSFGTDGAVTAAFSNEVVKGLQAHGISAVLKHFPGHGGTTADSHDGYAATERTLEELMAEDFVPFLGTVHHVRPYCRACRDRRQYAGIHVTKDDNGDFARDPGI